MSKYIFGAETLHKMERNPWLTDRQRRILNLYYRRGWRIEDIAAALYISRRTVDAELHKIRKIIA